MREKNYDSTRIVCHWLSGEHFEDVGCRVAKKARLAREWRRQEWQRNVFGVKLLQELWILRNNEMEQLKAHASAENRKELAASSVAHRTLDKEASGFENRSIRRQIRTTTYVFIFCL